MKRKLSFVSNSFGLLFLLGMLINACKCNDKSDDPKPKYKIAGKIYLDCSKAPLANYPIKIYQSYEQNLGARIDEAQATGTTDSLGNFSVDFEPNKSNQTIVLQFDAPNNTSVILSGIPKGRNVEDIVAYKSVSSCIKVSLDVINPHSALDTLKITDLASFSGLKISGPFHSGVLYIASNYQFYEPYYTGIKKSITWYFNKYNGYHDEAYFTIDKYCSDTIFVTATIN